MYTCHRILCADIYYIIYREHSNYISGRRPKHLSKFVLMDIHQHLTMHRFAAYTI